MAKTYNTPKRTHIVKTRLDDEEHADFLRRNGHRAPVALVFQAVEQAVLHDGLQNEVGHLRAPPGRGRCHIRTEAPGTGSTLAPDRPPAAPVRHPGPPSAGLPSH